MKLAYFLSSARWGGGEKHVLDLMSYFQENFDCFLVCPDQGVAAEKARQVGIKVIPFDFSRSPGPGSVNELAAALEAHNITRIHCHLNRASLFGSLLRLKGGFKVLSTIHGFSTPLYYLLPHHLIAVSRAIYQVQPFPIRRKTSVVYNGISPLEVKSEPPPAPMAGVFATLHPNKGQEFLIKTLGPGPLKHPVRMIGNGSVEYERTLIQLLDQAKERENLRLLLQTGDLEPYWRETSFVIIPSLKEALSYVALEALAQGIPVLASRTGGLAEVFSQGREGLYFEPGNPEDFRKKFSEMVQNWKAYKDYLVKNPFLKRNPKFQKQGMLRDIQNVYESIF